MYAQMEFLRKKLNERKEDGTLRQLISRSPGIDFFSNDYLGASQNSQIAQTALTLLQDENLHHTVGSSGSRLISGNLPFYEATEKFLAQHFKAESALVFPSGFSALSGLLSCIASREDTIIYDELIHASARDGMRLSMARHFSFRHNNPEDLRRKLKNATGRVFVVVESVYSMDGDFCTLDDIGNLKTEFDFTLILDEAHSGGIFGEQGKGLGLPFAGDEHVIRVMTFGKAFGVEGAAVLGPEVLRDYLINFSRPFIYSTAPGPHFFALIQSAVSWNGKAVTERNSLLGNITFFKSLVTSANSSPIQVFSSSDKVRLKELADKLKHEGFSVKAVFSPTVPEGKERIRLVIHSFNRREEISKLVAHMNAFGF
jgi:8-amino-7-oxononanoate synthase